MIIETGGDGSCESDASCFLVVSFSLKFIDSMVYRRCSKVFTEVFYDFIQKKFQRGQRATEFM